MTIIRTRAGRGICLLVALSATLFTQSAVLGAQDEALVTSATSTADVSLQANNELRGQLMSHQGRPQAQTTIAIFQNQKLIGYSQTDAAGRFSIRGLKPGVYQLRSAVGGRSVRLWAPQTAPPAAQQAVLIVADRDVTRAQVDMNRYGPAIRGAIAGGLVTGLTYWALDYNDSDAS